jgi:hypothetical protein
MVRKSSLLSSKRGAKVKEEKETEGTVIPERWESCIVSKMGSVKKKYFELRVQLLGT